MGISKAEQIAKRRERVLELASQNYTQEEIREKLGNVVSQQTISNDIAWLRETSKQFVSDLQKDGWQYRLILSNYYRLRNEAWKHFYSAGNENIKLELYGVLQSINRDIHEIENSSDIVDKELKARIKGELADLKNEMKDIISNGKNPPIF